MDEIAGLMPGDELVLSSSRDVGLWINGAIGTRERPIIISIENNATWDVNTANVALTPGDPLIRLTDCQYVQLKGIRIKGTFPPADGVLPTKKSHGIVFDGACCNCKVSDSVIEGFPGSGVYVKNTCLDSIDFHKTDFIWNGQNGLSHGGRSRNMVMFCRFIRNGNSPETYNGDGKGIGLNCGDSYALFNYLESNGSDISGDDFDISCDGESGNQTNEPVYVIGNYLKDCKQGGISIFGGNKDSLVAFNVVDGFNTAGYGTESAGQMSAIRIGKATPHTSMYDDSGIHISRNIFMNGGASQPSAACIALGLESGADQSGIVVDGNVFLNCACKYYTIDDTASGVSGAMIDNNIYFNSDGKYTDKWSVRGMARGDNYDSFDAWRATQAFTTAPDANGLNTDPSIIDSWMQHLLSLWGSIGVKQP